MEVSNLMVINQYKVTKISLVKDVDSVFKTTLDLFSY